jgi:phosphatidylserine decarboxylase
MMSLSDWLATDEVQKLKSESMGKLVASSFHRDPLRRIYIDPTVFYAPADGVILYAKEVQPGESILNIKGKSYTLQDALDDPEYNQPSIVVGIFMTQYSVHVNRVPTSGFIVERHRTPYLFTPRVSMKLEEDEIFENDIDPEDAGYLFANERRIVSVYSSGLKTRYYLIQIGEKDVDQICNFRDRSHYTQGDRYGIVRFGSQLEFILPLSKNHNYQIEALEKYVVRAGIDPIVRVLE